MLVVSVLQHTRAGLRLFQWYNAFGCLSHRSVSVQHATSKELYPLEMTFASLKLSLWPRTGKEKGRRCRHYFLCYMTSVSLTSL